MEARPQTEVPRFLTVAEAAALARCCVDTIYKGVRSGEIPGRRMGGKKARYIIPRASFLRYLEGDGPEPARKGGGGW